MIEIKTWPQTLAFGLLAVFACMIGSAVLVAGNNYGPESNASAKTQIMATSTALTFEPTRQVLDNEFLATTNQIETRKIDNKTNALIFAVWSIAVAVAIAAASISLALAARSVNYAAQQMTAARSTIQHALRHDPTFPPLPDSYDQPMLVLPGKPQNQNQTNQFLESPTYETQKN